MKVSMKSDKPVFLKQKANGLKCRTEAEITNTEDML